jgi:hypothetical protein
MLSHILWCTLCQRIVIFILALHNYVRCTSNLIDNDQVIWSIEPVLDKIHKNIPIFRITVILKSQAAAK